jgi:predicted nucleotidyltransferase
MNEPYKTLIEQLRDVLLRRYGERLYSLVIYGSVARGDASKASDIDLLLVVAGLPESRLARQEEFMALEDEVEEHVTALYEAGYHIDFSPIIKTPEEAGRVSSLYLDMVEDAILVYDRDRFFASVLERLRKRLDELGSKRVRMGRKWYWILKPDYQFGEVIELG